MIHGQDFRGLAKTSFKTSLEENSRIHSVFALSSDHLEA